MFIFVDFIMLSVIYVVRTCMRFYFLVSTDVVLTEKVPYGSKIVQKFATLAKSGQKQTFSRFLKVVTPTA